MARVGGVLVEAGEDVVVAGGKSGFSSGDAGCFGSWGLLVVDAGLQSRYTENPGDVVGTPPVLADLVDHGCAC